MSFNNKNDSDKPRPLPEIPKNNNRPLPSPPKRTMVRSFSRNVVNSYVKNHNTPVKSATTDSIPDKNISYHNKNDSQFSKKGLVPPPKKSNIKINDKPSPKKNTFFLRHKSVGRINANLIKKNFSSTNEIKVTKEAPVVNKLPLNSIKKDKKDKDNQPPMLSPPSRIKKKKRLSLDMSREKGGLSISTSFMNELNNTIVKSPLMKKGGSDPFSHIPPPPPPPPPPPTNKKNSRKDKSKKDAESLDPVVKKKKKKGCKAYVKMNLDLYKEMIDLLILNRFILIRFIDPHIKRKELDKVSKSFLSILCYKEVILDYIKTMIKLEIEAATQEGTLFRTNNICTGIMSSFSMKIGKQYLIKVLKPCFEWLLESKLDFEIDPNIVEDPEIVRKNIFNLNYLINKFFKSILNSVDIIPFEIREISNTLQQAVIKKFPNSLYTAVGGFFFLRFVVPAVINPDILDILEGRELDLKFKRALTLVGKTLQQIANNQKFNEPYMEPLNELMRKWTIDVHKFFNSLVQKDKAALEKERERVLEKMKEQEEHKNDDDIDYKSFLTVHRILYDHIDILSAKISEENNLGYDLVSELRIIFEKMGELPDDEKKKKSLQQRATSFFGKIQLKFEEITEGEKKKENT